MSGFDVRRWVDELAAGQSRAALRLAGQRPGVRLYLYYRPALGAEWGALAIAWDDERPTSDFLLAHPEPLPCNGDSRPLASWIAERSMRLPLCGSTETP